MSEPQQPANPTPPTSEVAEASVTDSVVDFIQSNGRSRLYLGLLLIFVSFLLSWWSLTKYRVWQERGEDLAGAEFIAKLNDMGEPERVQYQEELAAYRRAWDLNRTEHGGFYLDHVGDDYLSTLVNQDARSKRSGTIYFRGWSTWTGWFGLIFVILLLASQIAPKFAPQLEPYAWGFPWAGAIVFALFTLMALAFYFTVPDENGDGYSQGVGWGNYLALAGGVIVVISCVSDGMRSAERRIADIQARGDVEEEEEEDEPEEVPQKPAKSRLQDW